MFVMITQTATPGWPILHGVHHQVVSWDGEWNRGKTKPSWISTNNFHPQFAGDDPDVERPRYPVPARDPVSVCTAHRHVHLCGQECRGQVDRQREGDSINCGFFIQMLSKNSVAILSDFVWLRIRRLLFEYFLNMFKCLRLCSSKTKSVSEYYL